MITMVEAILTVAVLLNILALGFHHWLELKREKDKEAREIQRHDDLIREVQFYKRAALAEVVALKREKDLVATVSDHEKRIRILEVRA